MIRGLEQEPTPIWNPQPERAVGISIWRRVAGQNMVGQVARLMRPNAVARYDDYDTASASPATTKEMMFAHMRDTPRAFPSPVYSEHQLLPKLPDSRIKMSLFGG